MKDGEDGSVGVDFGRKEDASQDVVQGAKVFLVCCQIEQPPYITSVGGWVNVQVVKPQNNRGPCSNRSLGIAICYEEMGFFSAGSGVTPGHV